MANRGNTGSGFAGETKQPGKRIFMKHVDEYRDAKISQHLVAQIRRMDLPPIRLMEVCGTHTVSIFRNGIRSLLPGHITLLSGPGCPVCVTAQGEIDAFIELAGLDDTIVTTFGDLMRVPGTCSSLQKQRAEGKDIRMVYSTFDALDIARENPTKQVVFLGIGFETTAPTIAAALITAEQTGVKNFFVYCAHKLVPPALAALLSMPDIRLDGFLLPGHVSVVIGTHGYAPVFEQFQVPGVVAGFEPADILHAIFRLVCQIKEGKPALENAYPRVVSADGNPKAREMMMQVFAPDDAVWRGIGVIPQSGLKIREAYAHMDAARQLPVEIRAAEEPPGCACGEILTGTRIPPECPLYRKRCTPMNPVGPCMVSSEGTCAAYYRYYGDVS
jgi:hydrogenase expression/formation protein HypD